MTTPYSGGPTPTATGGGGPGPGASGPVLSNRLLVVVGIGAGFVLVPILAQFQPELVNGVLLLILVGTILGNADKWLPVMGTVFGAQTKTVKR